MYFKLSAYYIILKDLTNRKGLIIFMKHIKSLNTKIMSASLKTGGCGECQTSCQSACKTSCTVANQSCEKK